MTKFLLLVIAFEVVAATVAVIFALAYRKRLKEYKDMYSEIAQTNKALQDVIARLNKENKIRQEARKEKEDEVKTVDDANSNRDKFDAINNILSK